MKYLKFMMQLEILIERVYIPKHAALLSDSNKLLCKLACINKLDVLTQLARTVLRTTISNRIQRDHKRYY